MAEQKYIRAFDDLDLVVLRNPVAKARFHLSVYQTKFLLEVLSHLKSKPEARILSFNIRQFSRTLNLDNNDIKYYVLCLIYVFRSNWRHTLRGHNKAVDWNQSTALLVF